MGYHSLDKVKRSTIDVDTIYFDEAHNSVNRNFFPSVRYFSTVDADRSFFFTATPKHSLTPFKAGMNDREVYGDVLINVPAPKLVDEGYILPPKVEVYKSRLLRKDEIYSEVECEHMISAIDRLEVDKVLICAKSTRQITNLLYASKFQNELAWRGYSWMTITSKTGAIIDGEKVGRDEFFNVLNAWGKDDDKKFIVLHHSILAEGINVKGLEAALFMRNMDYITISQTIGRVIRLGNVDKTHSKNDIISPHNPHTKLIIGTSSFEISNWWNISFPHITRHVFIFFNVHRVITEIAGSPLLNTVSTTASTLRAVEIPTLLYTGTHTLP